MLGRAAGVAGRLRGGVTPTGWGLAGLVVTSQVVGSRYHWTELRQLAAAGGCLLLLGLVTMLVPRRPLVDLHLRPARVTVGQPAVATVEMRGGRTPMLAPVVDVPMSGQSHVVRLPIVTAGRPAHVSVELPTQRRGVIDVGPVIHVRSDLLGLFRRERRVAGVVPLHVRPVVVPLPSLAAGIVHDLEGVASDRLAASDLSFHALREYVPGDDPRHVHWKSTARAGSLLVRQFQLTRRSHATVMLDPDPLSYADSDEFELAVSAASSVALRAASDDYEVTFAGGVDAITTRDPQAMLDLACRFELGRGKLTEIGVKVAADIGGTSLVVLVTGSRASDRALRHAASHFPATADVVTIRADRHGEPRAVRSAEVTSLVLNELGQLSSQLVRAWP